MQKPVLIEGKEIVLSTLKVRDLEAIDLTGKTGRKWNTAMIAACISASGDTEHGTEAWVEGVLAFDPEGGDSEYQKLLNAMNDVNGFSKKMVTEKNAQEPVSAPAAG